MADTKLADLNPANTTLAEKFRTMEYGVAPDSAERYAAMVGKVYWV